MEIRFGLYEKNFFIQTIFWYLMTKIVLQKTVGKGLNGLVCATILLPQVRVSRTSSTLLSLIVKFVLYLPCEKNENKQKDNLSIQQRNWLFWKAIFLILS